MLWLTTFMSETNEAQIEATRAAAEAESRIWTELASRSGENLSILEVRWVERKAGQPKVPEFLYQNRDTGESEYDSAIRFDLEKDQAAILAERLAATIDVSTDPVIEKTLARTRATEEQVKQRYLEMVGSGKISQIHNPWLRARVAETIASLLPANTPDAPQPAPPDQPKPDTPAPDSSSTSPDTDSVVPTPDSGPASTPDASTPDPSTPDKPELPSDPLTEEARIAANLYVEWNIDKADRATRKAELIKELAARTTDFLAAHPEINDVVEQERQRKKDWENDEKEMDRLLQGHSLLRLQRLPDEMVARLRTAVPGGNASELYLTYLAANGLFAQDSRRSEDANVDSYFSPAYRQLISEGKIIARRPIVDRQPANRDGRRKTTDRPHGNRAGGGKPDKRRRPANK